MLLKHEGVRERGGGARGRKAGYWEGEGFPSCSYCPRSLPVPYVRSICVEVHLEQVPQMGTGLTC